MLSDTGGGPNGLAIGPDGALYLLQQWRQPLRRGLVDGRGSAGRLRHGWIERIDAKTGARNRLYTEVDGNKLSAPNDLVFDEHGGFYFTDLGKRYARHRDHGGLYYALPDGSKVMEIAYPILSPTAAACRRTTGPSTSPTPRARGCGRSTSNRRAC